MINHAIFQIVQNFSICFHMFILHLGILQYFTNLNSSAMKGHDFPKINNDFQGSGDQGSVVMKFTQLMLV